MIQHIEASLGEAQTALANLLANPEALASIDAAAQTLIASLAAGGRIFSCGNGGSMCDAMHFAEELTGRYRKNRRGMAAVAISDPSHMTCVANDYGYEFVFSRYLQAHARPGDLLVGISTSGTSKNVITAANYARDNGMKVLALTGKRATTLGGLADLEICTPGGAFADRTQELHIKVIHILIELVERALFPENYREAS
jgi:D-sedoheptulose 7-phosphate isomerase